MTKFIFVLFLSISISSFSQSLDQLEIRGNYTSIDSVQAVEAYLQARKAVELMYLDMLSIKNSINENEEWIKSIAFEKWLGSSKKSGISYRRIKQIHSKFQNRKVVLYVTKKNRGRCTGWISAWTLPHGKINIRLCEDFFMYRTNLQEKVLVHEMGHETGLLSHHRIHGCRAALRAASNDPNLAKRSTENYAWLAMSYIGIECISR